MNDGIGKVPPSPGDKPMEPIKPADDHKPKPIEPATKNVLGMQMTKKQAEDLTESIERFGLVDPLIVNKHKGRENIVIGGHQRLRIAINKGFKEVPVVYVDLNQEKEKELNVRLNKNLGDWDWDLLANFEKDFLKDVGFDSQELDKMLQLEEDDFDADEEVAKIDKPISKLGEIYQLGRHRLMCGDSTKKEDVERLMNKNKARLIFTDPPYNVNYDYTVTYVEGRARKNKFRVFNDKKSNENYTNFIKDGFKNAFNYSCDNASFYCWHASKNEHLVRSGLTEDGWDVKQTIYWLKNNATFNRGLDYFWITEPCYFGWKNGKTHYVNKLIVKKMQNIINLDTEDFEDLLNVIYKKKDIIQEYEHPTQKPIRLGERAIKKHSEIDDIVLDLFGGSGSTLIACEQADRICYMMELDQKYCDVIRNRYNKYKENRI